MGEIPSRADLAGIWTSLSAIAAPPAFGVARQRDNDRLSILYCYEHGFGGFILPNQDLPDAWRSDAMADSATET